MAKPKSELPARKSVGNKRPTSIDLIVGERVRLMRIGMGLTQEKLAAAIQVTFQQLQKYEKGVNRISAGRLAQLAEALGVTVAAFIDESGVGKTLSGDPTFIEIAESWPRLGPGRQRLVLELVRSLLGDDPA